MCLGVHYRLDIDVGYGTRYTEGGSITMVKL